jgi:DNA-binding transcriptional LysR family regulator
MCRTRGIGQGTGEREGQKQRGQIQVHFHFYDLLNEWIEVQSWMAARALSQRGLGVSLLPDFLVRKEANLVALKAPFTLLPYQLKIYYRKRQGLTRTAEHFLGVCLGIKGGQSAYG